MTNQSTLNIGFIGAGNMSTAGLKSLLDSGTQEKNIRITSPSIQSKDCYIIQTQRKNYQLKTVLNNNELINQCNIIVLGFKPYQLDIALANISQPIENKFFVSIMAGVSSHKISKKLNIDVLNIMRLMPNTPCAIGQGIGASYLLNSKALPPQVTETLNKISLAFGCPIVLDKEDKLNAVTAISGSGVAYVYLLCELLLENSKMHALQFITDVLLTEEENTPERQIAANFKQYMKQWALIHNLNTYQAENLVEQTFLGAYYLIENAVIERTDANILSLVQMLRANVTSKNGTTFAAIEVFKKDSALRDIISKMCSKQKTLSLQQKQQKALKQLVFNAMNAAHNRAVEISQEE